jgi:MOSC domain-containing protein
METVAVPSIAWIHVAPVKGLALVPREEVRLDRFGVADNRRLFLIDETGRLTNGKRLGRPLAVVPELDLEHGSLRLTFPDGAVAAGDLELAERVTTSFYGRPVAGRVVVGPCGDALSAFAGHTVRLVLPDEPGAANDRGADVGAVTMLGAASLQRLGEVLGVEAVDPRRFRMLFGIDGVDAHEEDSWIGRRVALGDAAVEVMGNVGRCVVTSRDPDNGERNLRTLDALATYRGAIETTEPLPFGVSARVAAPGRVRVGDAVSPSPAD